MIVVVGLSHRTAPIEVRERVALQKQELPNVLTGLCESPWLDEAMVVSTCNRFEVVAGAAKGVDIDSAAHGIQGLLDQRAPGVLPHLYIYPGGAGVRHLFRVASSLDSLVVGEPQILGQVKDAFDMAQQVGTVGAHLNQVVPRALRAAKKVRTETSIGAGLVSVPSVAVDLARQIFGELAGRTVALIGAGEMAETVAKLLGQSGARILVVGRSAERVQPLAERVNGQGLLWEHLPQALIEADVVISSTSAPNYIVDLELVKAVRRPRKGRSLFFIDLAVPRDIDPRCEAVDNVFVYNIDDLSKIVAESQSARAKEAERAEAIVYDAVSGYNRWREAAQVTPVVVALRKQFSEVLHQELERSLRGKLKLLGAEEQQALERMIESSVNKLLHAPTQRLRQAATERDGGLPLDELIHSTTELFELHSAGEELEFSSVRHRKLETK